MPSGRERARAGAPTLRPAPVLEGACVPGPAGRKKYDTVDATTRDACSSTSLERPGDSGFALVVLWAERAAPLIGSVLFVPRAQAALRCHFGRGRTGKDPDRVRLQLFRQRPGQRTAAGDLENPFVSRDQLEIVAGTDALQVDNRGRCPLVHAGRVVRQAMVRPGDVIELKRQLLMVCVARPAEMEPLRYAVVDSSHAFGAPDALGLVGESPQAWALRDTIAFVAQRNGHVLVYGASGTGKELVARAIHDRSSRSGGPFVARNAATLPPGLIDAELFGHAKDYPNASMSARPGLIGQANGGTLLLDEIGELPSDAQTHLLRVLDSLGEYQRLGESQMRRSEFRLVAATNRPVADLRADLAARLGLRVCLGGLGGRCEDIGLLVLHLLRRIARDDAAAVAKLFDGPDPELATPRVDLGLVHALATHDYTTHVRELENLLWIAIRSATSSRLSLTDEVATALAHDASHAAARVEVTRDQIVESIERNGGVRERVWRDLGLANRHVLKRLLKKHGLSG
jgi:DNA-binding NtrC family response regulator